MPTDTLTLKCPYCKGWYRSKTVRCGENLPPSRAARWHEALAAHIRKAHVRKRPAATTQEDQP